ncbi:MAG: hypothetical protein NT121_08845, partial [Chloroflexi bacterium]|nr:hypothetical protein [Chloroflexota bacterium]
MTISVFIQAFLIFAGLSALFFIVVGIRNLRTGIKDPFYRSRLQRMTIAWRWIGAALLMGTLAVVTAIYGKPLADQLTPTQPGP